MRILVLGAGGTGGYFGARLAEAGADVTFLVRARRAEQIERDGLRVLSRHGDIQLRPKLALSARSGGPWDLAVLSCKAYDLASAIDAIAPAVQGGAAVLPLLNGMRHFDALDARFGAERVIGGLCGIAATLDTDGTVRHLSDFHWISFGERKGGRSARCDALHAALASTKADVRYSENVMLDLWDKWVLLATVAGATCLMRGALGEIVATADGSAIVERLLGEAAGVAAHSGHPLPAERLEKSRAFVIQPGSTLTASMLRDMERGGSTEGEHVLGDMVERGKRLGTPVDTLAIARTHLQVYEHRRTQARS
jgi:2-dehydropantoate 2-reductase